MENPTPIGSGSFDAPGRGSFVYRHVGPRGEVLYVGLSDRLLSRTGAHEAASSWFPSVLRVEWEVFRTRAEAAAAERALIAELLPANNIVGAHNAYAAPADPDPEPPPPDALAAARALALGDRY